MSQEISREGRPASPTAILKAASLEKHQQLEASFPWALAFSSRLNYGRLLRALHSLVKGADGPIDRVLAMDGALGEEHSLPYGERRRRAGLIENDLRQIGAAGQGPVQALADFSFVDSRGAAIGALYVLEGSALGAQILSRELHGHLGITPETGGSYLHAYGPRTGETWQAFVAWANRELSSPDLLDSAVHASLMTFDRFSQHLTDLFDAR